MVGGVVSTASAWRLDGNSRYVEVDAAKSQGEERCAGWGEVRGIGIYGLCCAVRCWLRAGADVDVDARATTLQLL